MDIDDSSFCEALLSLKTKDECQEFLSTFWSQREFLDMNKRWHVFMLLSQGLKQSQIKDIVKVSKYKITRVSKALRNKSNGCSPIIMRITKTGNTEKESDAQS